MPLRVLGFERLALSEASRLPLLKVKDLSHYNEDYPPCAETYATLCIVGDNLSADAFILIPPRWPEASAEIVSRIDSARSQAR